MSHPEVGQGPQGTVAEESSAGALPKPDRPVGPEMGVPPGNGSQQMMSNQASNPHMMKQGPGPSPMPQHTGASPQQQLPSQPQQGGPMPGIHFPNVPTTSQSSRPKTPNRASPRPYHHPLTPTNRPPSTEPSEINLSPERLNASIAGLFPPKINIPLPPRQPNLNRGFDQQGLNPTTLKAIGQAPPNLTLPGNNNNGSVGGNNTNSNQQPFSAGAGAGGAGAKQDKPPAGQGKRASPSNSRRSSPASSRKSATPSPGRQKGTKMAITCPPPQQQLVNPQGQTMMLSPTSVPPSPVSVPSQVSGGMEVQQPQQSPFHGMHGNPMEGVRESQGMMAAEPRQMPPQALQQPLRELSAPRMASPRFPVPPPSKPDIVEAQGGPAERQPVHTAQAQEPEASPTVRTAPTSLNQLLDNTGIPNMPLRPMQSNTVMGKDGSKSALEPERPLHSNSHSTDVPATATVNESETKPKPAVPIPTSSPNMQPASIPSSHPSTNANSNTLSSLNQIPISSPSVAPSTKVSPSPTPAVSTNTNSNTSVSPSLVTCSQSGPASIVTPGSSTTAAVPAAVSALKPSPSPKPVTSVHSVIQLPASSSISPNQITVFVTSNPITSGAAPQAPTSMVPTVVAVPSKNIRPQDVRQQTPVPRPQFIATTPLYINPVFQVTGASVAPNATVVSQPVTMMGPIQVSTTNIQLSPALSSTQSSGATATTTQLVRSSIGQVQITSALQAPQPVQQGLVKPENISEASSVQKTSPPIQQPPVHPSPSAPSPFQPPLASPPPSSSPSAVTTMRKSPMSPPPTTQVRAKPANAPTADSQQSPGERPAQGPARPVPPQGFHPPASPAVQMEAHTTAAAGAANVALPPASSPVPTPAQVSAQTVTQAPVPPPAPVSSPAQPAATPPPATAATAVSSAPSLPTVAPTQNPVASVVPIVATTGPIQEAPPTPTPTPTPTATATTSPVPNPGGAPPTQPDPTPVEPPAQPAAAPAETTQTTAGKCDLSRSGGCVCASRALQDNSFLVGPLWPGKS